LASRVAMGADLVLLVIDSDLTRTDREALQTLLSSGKPLHVVLNRSDRWPGTGTRSTLQQHSLTPSRRPATHRCGRSTAAGQAPARWPRS
jgi:predicted GTPase